MAQQMAQQQINYQPQTASQSLGDQQWGANNGNVFNFHNSGPIYYGPYGPFSHVQGSAAPSSVQNSRPQFPVPDAHIPGFTHMGHGVQQHQPRFGGTSVQSHTTHVCARMGDITDRGNEILRILCNDLVERSEHTRDCGFVGETVSKDCIKLFDQDEQKAKDKFWRRAQRTASQRKGRADVKQQKALAKQPDVSQQWPANTQIYLQQMVDGNAGNFQTNADMGLNGMIPGHNAGAAPATQVQMQQGAPQGLPLQDFAQFALQSDQQPTFEMDPPFDQPMDPQYKL